MLEYENVTVYIFWDTQENKGKTGKAGPKVAKLVPLAMLSICYEY